MSDLDNITEDETPAPAVDEVAELRKKCDLLGIKQPHPSATAETIRKKISEHMANVNQTLADAAEAEQGAAEEAAPAPEQETAGAKRARLRKEALRLVRINIQCLDPAKKEWDGEIFTVGNTTVGTVRKFVPFNTTEGYHVPHIMYEMLKNKECQVFQTVKLKNGGSHRQGVLKRAFAIEVLPPLTKAELEELARQQALAGSID
jgi:hypothetical protein